MNEKESLKLKEDKRKKKKQKHLPLIQKMQNRRQKAKYLKQQAQV